MSPWRKRIVAGLAILASHGLLADEKPAFLAAFDPQTESIQVEFDNSVERGCLWRPYGIRDAVKAQLAELGYTTSDSSLWVMNVFIWGAATDDYHCALVLETVFTRHGVPAEAGPNRMVSTELRVWDAIEMLTGPKVNMDDRVLVTVAQRLAAWQQAMEKAARMR
jgi:hypothetical protein